MSELEQEIQAFFRSFALQVINDAKADANDPRAVKQAMLKHYEPRICPYPNLQSVSRRL